MTNHLFDGLFEGADRSQTLATLPGGNRYSYGDALDLSARFANVLQDWGVSIGDRVAAQVPKSIEAVFLYMACVRMGAVFLPLNTAYTSAEVGYFVADSGAKLLLCDPLSAQDYSGMAAHNGCRLETLGATGESGVPEGSLMGAAAGAPPSYDAVSRHGEDLAAILYTSGTTGRSKGAMLTHDNLLSNSLALKKLWRFTADDNLLHALPIFLLGLPVLPDLLEQSHHYYN